ncbi:MAG TPA: hypothetical protein VH062_08645 [Polyangiaceae bacterium]|jgi:hypothetical protein|nr:hypothetical protein [Polyangiaceae bacterium]
MKMPHVLGLLTAALLFPALLVPAAEAKDAACVGISSRAVYRAYGYDHIVHLVNRCDDAAACDVSTDVNPEPTHATVPANGEVDVLTFRGSPASTFTPHVTCRSAH